MRDLLVRHELAYRFLSAVFHAPPAAAFINRLAAGEMLAEWPLGAATEDARTGVRLMEAFCAAWDECRLADLESDFNRLFVGPGHPLAPPWESYYLSPGHLLFQEQTLAVRQAYESFGLSAGPIHREPDDSLGLELSFMAELCGMRLAALVAGQDEAQDKVLQAQREFLVSHLLRWAPQCLRLVIENARLDYYRGAAFLGLECLNGTGRALGLEVST